MRPLLKKLLFASKNLGGRKNIKKLKDSTKNENVSVICSGPSIKYLKSKLPKSLIFCCNFSPNFLHEDDKKIHLYITTTRALKEGLDLQSILSRFEIENFIIDSIDSLDGYNLDRVKNLFQYDSRDNFLVRKMLSLDLDRKIKKQKGELRQVSHISSGMQLIQYALYSGATTINTIGLDMSEEIKYGEGLSYKVDPDKKVNRHLVADKYFLKKARSTYKGVAFGKLSL